MTNPNIANINSFYSLTKSVNVTTGLGNVLYNPIFSNICVKINGLIISNESPTSTANINVSILDSVRSQNNLSTRLLLNPGNVFTLLNRTNEFSLTENSSLRANADVNNAIKVTVTYDILSEYTNISFTSI